MLVVVNCLMCIRFGHNFFNELYWTGQIFVWTGQRFVWTCHRKMSDLWSYFLRFSGWSFSIGELTPLASTYTYPSSNSVPTCLPASIASVATTSPHTATLRSDNTSGDLNLSYFYSWEPSATSDSQPPVHLPTSIARKSNVTAAMF